MTIRNRPMRLHRQGSVAATLGMIVGLVAVVLGPASPAAGQDATPEVPTATIETPAAGSDTPVATAPPVESTLGLTRQAPASPNEEVVSEGYGVTLLESIQGEPAADRLAEVDPNNAAPAEGQEYVLVRVRVRNVESGSEAVLVTGANFGLTASAARLYPAAAVVPPQPELRGEIYQEGALEGWVALSVFEGETNRQLVLLPGAGADPATFRYMAIDLGATMAADGAGIVDPAGYSPVSLPGTGENDLGATPDAPAGAGAAVITGPFAIQVVEFVRGEEATAPLAAANQFNPVPLPQNENVLVRVRATYLGPEQGPMTVSPFDFSLIGAGNVRYSQTGLVVPTPALDGRLYPGGTIEGFLAYEIQRSDSDLLLVYQPVGGAAAEPRYLLLATAASETPTA